MSARVPVVPKYPGFLRSFPGVSGCSVAAGEAGANSRPKQLPNPRGRSRSRPHPALRASLEAQKQKNARAPRKGKGREKGGCAREGILASVPQPRPSLDPDRLGWELGDGCPAGPRTPGDNNIAAQRQRRLPRRAKWPFDSECLGCRLLRVHCSLEFSEQVSEKEGTNPFPTPIPPPRPRNE